LNRKASMQKRSDIGHSTNLLGISTRLLASRDFNDDPRPLHISGVREMNRSLFEMLGQAVDLPDASEAFHCYMTAMFGGEPEQQAKQRPGETDGAAKRRFRSSYLRLLKGWGYDSNGPEGAVLKGWVESRFGIFPTYHKQVIDRFSGPAWAVYVEEKMSSRFHNNSIYTQLDLLYEFSQWALSTLAAPGQTHVTLYRGVNGFEEHPIVERIDKRAAVLRINNLASFSSDRGVAECFGDTILTASAPLSKVVFFRARTSIW
jgi:NAD+--dinitrogen-reductase ADP-D-ribosyltransferase